MPVCLPRWSAWCAYLASPPTHLTCLSFLIMPVFLPTWSAWCAYLASPPTHLTCLSSHHACVPA